MQIISLNISKISAELSKLWTIIMSVKKDEAHNYIWAYQTTTWGMKETANWISVKKR